MKLWWTYAEWLGRWPSTGSDELWRHTLVLPWPIAYDVDEDGDLLYRALVVVVRPWWLCRTALRRSNRQYIRWERGLTRALDAMDDLGDDYDWEREFDRIRDEYKAAHGPQPDAHMNRVLR